MDLPEQGQPENEIQNDSGAPRRGLPSPPLPVVLLTLFGLFLLGGGLSVLLYMGLCKSFGWPELVDPSLLEKADGRWQMRLQLSLGHLFGFCVPGFLTAWLHYRSITQKMPDWRDYLGLRVAPSLLLSTLTVMLMLAAIPVVLYAFSLNQMLPIPEEFRLMEAKIADDLKGLLIMDHPVELLANLVLIALLPAIGEELVFRGILQNQLLRVARHPWVAILTASIVFSAVHMQFEGFLPRVMLGAVLGWLYWRTQNFWLPMLAHFFNNGIQVFAQYLYSKGLISVNLEDDMEIPWQFALMSLFMTLVLVRFIHQTVGSAGRQQA
jgi:uncharacterized protein